MPNWDASLYLMGPAHRALTVEVPAFSYDVLYPHAASLDLWATEYRRPSTTRLASGRT